MKTGSDATKRTILFPFLLLAVSLAILVGLLWTPPEPRALFGPEPPAAGECEVAARIKAGMTRADIEKYMHLESSRMRYLGERYFSYLYKPGESAGEDATPPPACMLKINFRPHELSDNAIYDGGPKFEQWLREHSWVPNPRDVAVSVSAPFIDRPCCSKRVQSP